LLVHVLKSALVPAADPGTACAWIRILAGATLLA
jgi:hypothetical protein